MKLAGYIQRFSDLRDEQDEHYKLLQRYYQEGTILLPQHLVKKTAKLEDKIGRTWGKIIQMKREEAKKVPVKRIPEVDKYLYFPVE